MLPPCATHTVLKGACRCRRSWPQVLERAGVQSHTAATLLTSAVGGSKVSGWKGCRNRSAAMIEAAAIPSLVACVWLCFVTSPPSPSLQSVLSPYCWLTRSPLASLHAPCQMLGVLLSFFLVDSLGRRPLLVWGSLGCAAALGALCLADWLALKAFLVAGMCAFIFAFRWAARGAGICHAGQCDPQIGAQLAWAGVARVTAA